MHTSRFAQYAAAGSNRMFVGMSLKFVKGEWQMGPDRDLISPNTRLVAVMPTLTVGWQKWVDGKSDDSRMGLVADGFRAPYRDELDDLDSEDWETDEYGKRIDPWQKTNLLVFVEPNEPHALFTFSTTSAGGQNAVYDLSGAYGRTIESIGQFPVVQLHSGSYDHKIKARGRIDYPIFKIVDRVEAAPFNAIVAEAHGGAAFIPTSPPALTTPATGSIAITSGRTPPIPPTPPEPPPIERYEGPEDGADDLTEDIPF